MIPQLPEPEVFNWGYTRRQLAQYLHLNERTLANWACKGKGPRYVRVGLNCFYPEEEVRTWLETLPRFQSTAEEHVAKEQYA